MEHLTNIPDCTCRIKGRISVLEKFRHLPRTAKMSVLAAHLLLVLYNKSEAKFITGTPTYTEAHKILKDSVKTDKHEQAAICIVNGQEGYCFAPEQKREVNTVKFNFEGKINSLIKQCSYLSIKNNAHQWKVLDIHTHPDYAVNDMNKGYQIAPPSVTDIKHAMYMLVSVYDKTKLSDYRGCEKVIINQVYDKNGIWSYVLSGDVEDYKAYISVVDKFRIERENIYSILEKYEDKFRQFINNHIDNIKNSKDVYHNMSQFVTLIALQLDYLNNFKQDERSGFTKEIHKLVTDSIEFTKEHLKSLIALQQKYGFNNFELEKKREILDELNSLQSYINALEPNEFLNNIDKILYDFTFILYILHLYSADKDFAILAYEYFVDQFKFSNLLLLLNYTSLLYKDLILVNSKKTIGALNILINDEFVDILGIDKNVVQNLSNLRNMLNNNSFVPISEALNEYFNTVESIINESISKSNGETVSHFFKRNKELWHKYKSICDKLGINIDFTPYNK